MPESGSAAARAEVLQGRGDDVAPLPDRMLGRAKLQRREHQDIDRQPGRHSDADVDQPVADVGNRLMAAEEQREQRGEGHLSTLVSQPVPAADQHPGDDDDRDARDPGSQHHADRNGQGRAQQEPGHVLDTFAQGACHRRVDAQQRRERREVGIGLADRVPGQRPRPDRGDRPLDRQPDLILPVPQRPRRGGPQRHAQPRGPHPFQAVLRVPDDATSQHPVQLPRNPDKPPRIRPARATFFSGRRRGRRRRTRSRLASRFRWGAG